MPISYCLGRIVCRPLVKCRLRTCGPDLRTGKWFGLVLCASGAFASGTSRPTDNLRLINASNRCKIPTQQACPVFRAHIYNLYNMYNTTVYCENMKLTVGVCYRSPSSKEDNDIKLFDLINHLCMSKRENLLLLGDFNWPNINWSSWTSSSKSGSELKF